MKRLSLTDYAIITAAVCILALSGCAATPIERAEQAELTFLMTSAAIDAACVAGVIEHDDCLRLEGMKAAAGAAIAVVKREAQAGNTDTFNVAMKAALEALAELAKWKQGAATRPADPK